MPWSSASYKYQETTRAVIGAAMEVHRQLGFGFLETVYETALVKELEARGIDVQRQAEITVKYKGDVVGQFKADLLAEGVVIVELKAVKVLTEVDEAQLLNYLKATDIEVGLLINFGEPSLRYRRLVFSNQRKSA